MNKTAAVVGFAAAVVGLVAGIAVVHVFQPSLGGDFAGGIIPNSQLFTANITANSLTPNVSNFLVNGAVSAGGTSANNQITAAYTAVAVYPSAAITIPSSTFTTAATTTQVAFTAAGFVIGDPCEVQYSFTTSTLLTSANVTAVNGSSVTTTVQFLNVTGATIAATVTSTVTGVSSTVKTTCFATGV